MAAYIRHDTNGIAVSPQPNSSIETDVYGNSFENWCADYEGTDVDGVKIKTGCLSQDPQNKKGEFIFHDVDNNVRNPSAYIKSPLIHIPFINDNIGTDTELILGAAEDRDIIIFVAGNQQYLKLEPLTQLLPGTVYS